MTTIQNSPKRPFRGQHDPRALRLTQQRRLPSVESQTLDFMEFARQKGEAMSAWAQWAGFAVFLRYAPSRQLTDALAVGECLAISTIRIPERLQHRGWFWRYCQLCLCIVDDALILEGVVNPALREALRRRPECLEFHAQSFVLRRSSDQPWSPRAWSP